MIWDMNGTPAPCEVRAGDSMIGDSLADPASAVDNRPHRYCQTGNWPTGVAVKRQSGLCAACNSSRFTARLRIGDKLHTSGTFASQLDAPRLRDLLALTAEQLGLTKNKHHINFPHAQYTSVEGLLLVTPVEHQQLMQTFAGIDGVTDVLHVPVDLCNHVAQAYTHACAVTHATQVTIRGSEGDSLFHCVARYMQQPQQEEAAVAAASATDVKHSTLQHIMDRWHLYQRHVQTTHGAWCCSTEQYQQHMACPLACAGAAELHALCAVINCNITVHSSSHCCGQTHRCSCTAQQYTSLPGLPVTRSTAHDIHVHFNSRDCCYQLMVLSEISAAAVTSAPAANFAAGDITLLGAAVKAEVHFVHNNDAVVADVAAGSAEVTVGQNNDTDDGDIGLGDASCATHCVRNAGDNGAGVGISEAFAQASIDSAVVKGGPNILQRNDVAVADGAGVADVSGTNSNTLDRDPHRDCHNGNYPTGVEVTNLSGLCAGCGSSRFKAYIGIGRKLYKPSRYALQSEAARFRDLLVSTAQQLGLNKQKQRINFCHAQYRSANGLLLVTPAEHEQLLQTFAPITSVAHVLHAPAHLYNYVAEASTQACTSKDVVRVMGRSAAGDGLFQCVTQHMQEHNSLATESDVRTSVLQHIISNWQVYKSHVQTTHGAWCCTTEQYQQHMACPLTCAGDAELHAICAVYDSKIAVHSSSHCCGRQHAATIKHCCCTTRTYTTLSCLSKGLAAAHDIHVHFHTKDCQYQLMLFAETSADIADAEANASTANVEAHHPAVTNTQHPGNPTVDDVVGASGVTDVADVTATHNQGEYKGPSNASVKVTTGSRCTVRCNNCYSTQQNCTQPEAITSGATCSHRTNTSNAVASTSNHHATADTSNDHTIAANSTRDPPPTPHQPCRHQAASTASRNFEASKKSFLRLVDDSCQHACCCCQQTFFRSGVSVMTDKLRRTIQAKQAWHNIIPTVACKGKQYLCHTCKKDVIRGKTPEFSSSNGMVFPPQPHVLKKLNDLEATLVALHIPFMTMQTRCGPRGQWALKGPIAAVPVDNYQVQHKLPRLLHETHSIMLQLKRKMIYKGYYMKQLIRPNVVMQAMRYLVRQPIYVAENIQIDPTWAQLIRNTVRNDPKFRGFIINNECHAADLPIDNEAPCCECGDPTPTRSNRMVFCDRCNGAYHQKCVGLTRVPGKTEMWLCPNCELPDSIQQAACGACGESDWEHDNPFIFCDVCDGGYHISCLGMVEHPGNDASWCCGQCQAIDADAEIPEGDPTTEPQTGTAADPSVYHNNHIGNQDTVLTTFLDDASQLHDAVQPLAPCEYNTPIGFFSHQTTEEGCFPREFCGHARRQPASGNKIHYSKIVKWELRSRDRRFANNPRNIFFKFKKHIIQQVQHRVFHKARKGKLTQQNITAGQCKTDSGVRKSLLDGSVGHRVFAQLKGSPAYWDTCKKEVFAMIRQLGAPTWFFTFSAAEFSWLELICALQELDTGQPCSKEQAAQLPVQRLNELVQKDPVTCSRHFQHRFTTFKNELMVKCNDVMSGVTDFYYRIEFQHRGAPHVHGLAWCQNAPSYDPDDATTTDAVVEYVDKHTTCQLLPATDPIMQCQTHRHSAVGTGCQKKRSKHAICAHGFPKPPMEQTTLLTPLTVREAGSAAELQRLKQRWLELHQIMNGLTAPPDISRQEFYDLLHTTEAEFQKALRASLQRPKLFLQRRVNEIWINGYLRHGAAEWAGNHDLQFVLDPYAAANYVVSYMMKGNMGMSVLMDLACKEASAGNLEIKQAVRHVANRLLRAQEVCAQEAVYHLLQLPFKESSRACIYIDTSPLNDRIVSLESEGEIEQLDDDASIVLPGLHEAYSNRPDQLEQVCLADYACWYDRRTRRMADRDSDCDSDCDMDLDLAVTEDEEEVLARAEREAAGVATGGDPTITATNTEPDNYRTQLPATVPGCVLRRKAKILRCRGFTIESQPEEYCREKLMLFKAWRSEGELLGPHVSYRQAFEVDKDFLLQHAQRYDLWHEHLDSIVDEVETWQEQEAEDHTLACDDQHATDDAGLQDTAVPTGADAEHVGRGDFDTWAADDNTSYRQRTVDVRYTASTEEYMANAQMLNAEQRKYFYHILNKVKHQQLPFYEFLSGGAGVGKSVLTRAITQGVIRWANAQAGSEDGCTKVLVMACTNKAAANVNGTTPYTGLSIPIKTAAAAMKPLSDSGGKKAELLDVLKQLQLVIIDEVSMMSGYNGLLACIDKRLRQIRNRDEPFGGLPVLFVGDLFQLTPGRGTSSKDDQMVFAGNDSLDAPADNEPIGMDIDGSNSDADDQQDEPEVEDMPAQKRAKNNAGKAVPRFCNNYTMLGPGFWKENVQLYELTEIMRQKDAKEWAALLNRLREHQLTEEDKQFLQSLVIKVPFSHPDYPKFKPHQFTNNNDVNRHNVAVLEAADGPLYKLKAKDQVKSSGEGRVSRNKEVTLLNTAKTLAKNYTRNLLPLLELKVGCRVEIGCTYGQADKLSNGFDGYVRQIDAGVPGVSDTVHTIWVEFDKPEVGAVARAGYERQGKRLPHPNWTPVHKIQREFLIPPPEFKQAHQGDVIRWQFPLQGAAARTSNRSQGVTEHKGGAVDYETTHTCKGKRPRRLYEDNPCSYLPYHTHYVTLGRYTHTHREVDGQRIQEVFILKNAHLDKIRVHPGVVAEMWRLRTTRQVNLSYQPLSDMPGPAFSIAVHNASSAHKHMQHIRADYDLHVADLVFILESKAAPTDDPAMYTFPQLPHLLRCDSIDSPFRCGDSLRPFHGLLAYSRKPWLQPCSTYTAPGLDVCAVTVAGPGGAVACCAVYRSPQIPLKASVQQAQAVLARHVEAGRSNHQLQYSAIIMAGDFNADMRSGVNDASNQCLTAVMNTHPLQFQLASAAHLPTHDTGSHLDSIWLARSSWLPTAAGVSPTYWSDHAISWIQLSPTSAATSVS